MGVQDHYVLLGVPRGATAAEIRRAYRGLAAKWHPDRNHSPEAKEKFRRISEAYDILSDSAKRAAYDMGGTAAAPPPTRTSPFQFRTAKKPKKKVVQIAEDFRRPMTPGTVYIVRPSRRPGPVPVVSTPDPAMPEVPLWTRRRS